jgi:hypothetical protein
MRRPRFAGLLLGLLVLTVLAWAPTAAAAPPSKCLIINDALNANYTSLQAAQDAASPEATLWVRGTCTGTTEITKNLTLTGQQPRGFTAPTLNGGGQGSVLTIDSGVTVTINTLTITGGSGTYVPELETVVGGGILNNDNGSVTLNGTSITGNTAPYGGGIANPANGGSVTLNDTSITGNTAGTNGGGIINGGTVTLNGTSSISGNTARQDSGGILSVSGSVTLNDTSSITGNTAAGGDGGGIGNNTGTVTLNDNSSITDNTAPNGGGILNLAGSVTLNNSGSITGNTAGSVGGGIYNLFGTVTLNNSTTITGNTAGTDGGGIYNNFTFGGSVTLNDTSSITGNNPNNCAPPGSVPGCTG